MAKPIQLPVLIAGLSTKVDGSIKIVLETREFKPEEATQVFALRNQEAWAILAANEIKEEDVKLPTEKADPAIGTKTPSQRLRAVLYRLWEQTKSGVDFESYYRVNLEKIIDQLKGRLEQ